MQNLTNASADPIGWHGTTILCVRRDGTVTMAGDGQVSMGQTIVKGNARKVRRIGAGGTVIAGFAGATADAFTLLERLESKLERYPNQLERACVELAKDWRTDRYLRRLEALMAVADKDRSFTLTGNGDVLEPEDGVIGIGSGGNYALAAARALMSVPDLTAEDIARRAMKIAADICVYTNGNTIIESIYWMSPHTRRERSSRNSTASSWGREMPSARWPSRCVTAGAVSNCPRASVRRSCPRTS